MRFAKFSEGPVAQWIRHRPTEPGIAGSKSAGVIVLSSPTNLHEPGPINCLDGVGDGNLLRCDKPEGLINCACEVATAQPLLPNPEDDAPPQKPKPACCGERERERDRRPLMMDGAQEPVCGFEYHSSTDDLPAKYAIVLRGCGRCFWPMG